MNVSFFLLPKSQVVWVHVTSSMRDAFSRMEESGYTAIPMLDDQGAYAGTITEGDLLRHLMHLNQVMSPAAAERIALADVKLRVQVTPVDIDAHVERLFDRAIGQNFVPVQDSRNVFIGIVPRRRIIEYCAGMLRAKPVP